MHYIDMNKISEVFSNLLAATEINEYGDKQNNQNVFHTIAYVLYIVNDKRGGPSKLILKISFRSC